MTVWNATVDYPVGARLCKVPSPTDFAYPASYSVQALVASAAFTAAADEWTEGKDDLSASGSYKYIGGVLLPDGRVVLVPDAAAHVGLYDAGGTASGAAYTVPALPPARNALLLPYYNKL